MAYVLIKNLEPCWVEYTLSVDIPDEIARTKTPGELRQIALAECFAGDYKIEWGPSVKDNIEGFDQEFEIVEVHTDKPSPPTPIDARRDDCPLER